MEKVKVFLSDPQILFREGIHFILSGEDDFEVTGETTGNEEAFSLIQTNPPNIAILSLHDTKADGLEITRRIRRNLSSVYVILITDENEPENILLVLKSGASARINKDTEPEHLLDIIRVVAQGSLPIMEELFNPGVASLVITEFTDLTALSDEFSEMLASLAPKELQILNSIAAKSTIDQVAAKVEMTEDNVRRNIRMVLNKLVSNDHARTIIEAAQRSMPSIIRTGKRELRSDYITRAEFNEFKDRLMERLKSLIV